MFLIQSPEGLRRFRKFVRAQKPLHFQKSLRISLVPWETCKWCVEAMRCVFPKRKTAACTLFLQPCSHQMRISWSLRAFLGLGSSIWLFEFPTRTEYAPSLRNRLAREIIWPTLLEFEKDKNSCVCMFSSCFPFCKISSWHAWCLLFPPFLFAFWVHGFRVTARLKRMSTYLCWFVERGVVCECTGWKKLYSPCNLLAA